MASTSLTRLLSRAWMLVVAALVVAVAGLCIYELRGIFGSQRGANTHEAIANDIVPFNPKHVVLEVFGAPGAVASVNFLDIDAQPQRVENAPLPWSYDATTTKPTVLVNIMTQGDGDLLGCRITIDGVVKAERVVNIPSAYTFCLDKSG